MPSTLSRRGRGFPLGGISPERTRLSTLCQRLRLASSVKFGASLSSEKSPLGFSPEWQPRQCREERLDLIVEALLVRRSGLTERRRDGQDRKRDPQA